MSFNWGYNDNNGPEVWLSHFPEACGNFQSPIDIKCNNPKVLESEKKLTWKYIPENSYEITNPGYCWKVLVNPEGSELTGGPLGDDLFVLEQFHCHWGENDNEGSEHTVCGARFSGELHLVHYNVTKYSTFEEAMKHPDGLCVLGVFLKLGKSHDELGKIVWQLTNIEYKGTTAKLPVPVDPALLLPKNQTYWTYQGSLTTPPCSECVIWIVFKDPIEVSHEQLNSFRNLRSYPQQQNCPFDTVKGRILKNFRPPLEVGEREVRQSSQ